MATGRESTTLAREIVRDIFVAILAVGLTISWMAGLNRMRAASRAQGDAANFKCARYAAVKNPLLRQVVQHLRLYPLDGLRLRKV